MQNPSENGSCSALLHNPASSHSDDNDDDTGYEEFFGGTLPCPTCRGSGRVPRECEHQLLALIPFSDKRLKPSRTVTYVIIAVCICIVIGGLLLFFFYPRSVSLHSNMPVITPQYIVINETQPYLFMSIRNYFNISNSNFVSISTVELSMTVQVDQRQVALAVNRSELTVPMRSRRIHYVQVNITLSSQEQKYIVQYCNRKGSYAHTILMPFHVTLTTSFLGHLEQSSLTTYQQVQCSIAKLQGDALTPVVNNGIDVTKV